MSDAPKPLTSPPNVLVVIGPTASGKSALAVDLAKHLHGVVINADSMQLYADLSVLTARPTVEEMQSVPHRLYGVLDGDETCSAQAWRDMAEGAIRETLAAGQVPILCGGTGFYLKAMLEGLSPIPEIEPKIRAAVREDIKQRGSVDSWEVLRDLDPISAQRIEPTDAQRIARALEVHRATGRTLSDWHDEPLSGPPNGLVFATLCLNPPRDALRERCGLRLDRMVEGGALDEVTRLLDRRLPANRPIMKAVGVPELASYLSGNVSLEEAVETAKTATRRYAKRQQTWLKSQIISQISINAQYSEKLLAEFLSFIRGLGLIPP